MESKVKTHDAPERTRAARANNNQAVSVSPMNRRAAPSHASKLKSFSPRFRTDREVWPGLESGR
jgi:hypothetical protein